MSTLELDLEGMTCGGCVATATRTLRGLDGVTAVEVTLSPQRARVEGEALDAERLTAALGRHGYRVVAARAGVVAPPGAPSTAAPGALAAAAPAEPGATAAPAGLAGASAAAPGAAASGGSPGPRRLAVHGQAATTGSGAAAPAAGPVGPGAAPRPAAPGDAPAAASGPGSPGPRRLAVRGQAAPAVAGAQAPAPGPATAPVTAAGAAPTAARADVAGDALWLDVDGMTCGSCVARVERALAAVQGVRAVEVSLPRQTARVLLAPVADGAALPAALRGPLVADLVAAGARAGYAVRAQAGGPGPGPRGAGATAQGEAAAGAPAGGAHAAVDDPLAREAAADRRRLVHERQARARALFALTLLVPFVALAFAHDAHGGPLGWFQAGLSLVVLAAGGGIFAGAWRRLRAGGANMDTLVALGALGAWGLSVVTLVTEEGGHLHFEATAMIVGFVLLGRWLEARAQGRTGQALRRLLDLRPRTALRLDPDGGAREVPLDQVAVGDRLRVLPGATVPTDALVLEGRSEVDEALLTGEALPVPRGPGARVLGGARNGAGALVVRAERVGAETALAGIVALVARAQGTKARIEGTADRIAGRVVPAVLALALLTGVARALWPGPGPGGPGAADPAVRAASLRQGVLAAVAVLVVACPCALGLATPTAIVVAVGRAAREGLLVRDARALEDLAEVTHVVFDKTGTLTRGAPAVVEVLTAGQGAAGPGGPGAGPDADRVVALAAALARASDHPLARGVAAEAARRGLAVPEAVEAAAAPGLGVSARVEGAAVRMGALAWAAPAPADAAAGLAADLAARLEAAAAAQAGALVAVALDGRLVGGLVLRDAARAEAREAVDAVRALGLAPVLLSGDREAAARAAAAEVGIDDVRAGVSPAGKLEVLRALEATGAHVAMVGDGWNDAPALAAARVGIAVGGGVDAAREAAALTLAHDDPRGVARAVALARRTRRTIRENLAWAFGYNLVAIPLAMSGHLAPGAAAAAMAASSVLVVGNSLRLGRATAPDA